MPESDPSETVEWLRDAFETHHPMLLAYALRMTGGKRDWADEAVQETFLRLCRQQREHVAGHLRAWLFRVCRQRIIDMQRTNHAVPISSAGALPSAGVGRGHTTHGPSEMVDWKSAPSEQVEQAETHDRLRALIEHLPARQRDLLFLKVHSQLSYREIAEATGLSVSNVGYLLHQAMQTLRSQILASDSNF